MSAPDLLAAHADLLQSIRERAALADSAYEADIAPAIAAVAEFVQQLPASEAHHHAGPGGLLRHSLEVVSGALALRRGTMLPPGAAAEAYRRQEHHWTVAVLLAALLHDAGKPAADLRVTLLDPSGAEKLWQPLIWSMPQAGALWYRVAFVQPSEREYARHARLAAGLLQRLVPAPLLAWLAESTPVWEALLDYLTGVAASGPIGRLVREADSASVARDLAHGPRTRFACARVRPLVERMMEAVRRMLAEGGYFALSRSGADAWVESDTIWFVSRTLANQVRSYLAAHDGEAGVPADNNRLFDVWQDHRACLANPTTGRAIWRVDIEGEGYRLPGMTVLAFRVSDLFEEPPTPMRGRVVPCAKQEAEPESKPAAAQSSEAGSDSGAVAVDGVPAQSQVAETLPASADVASLDQDQESAARTSSARRGAGLDKEDARALADAFMQWIAEGIASGHLLTNNRQAFIHVVPQGLLLVSPIAFKSFVHDRQGGDYETVQRAVLAQGWHRKGPKGVNFVRYQIALAGVSYGFVSGALLPEPGRWVANLPPVNQALGEALA